MSTEKNKVEEVDKAKTTSQSEDKQKETEIKKPDTNLIQNKYEVAVKLQDLQADPNSPLFSVKSFEELGL
jgi:ATP-dependent RNA helicase DDX19/DBP5